MGQEALEDTKERPSNSEERDESENRDRREDEDGNRDDRKLTWTRVALAALNDSSELEGTHQSGQGLSERKKPDRWSKPERGVPGEDAKKGNRDDDASDVEARGNPGLKRPDGMKSVAELLEDLPLPWRVLR